MCDVPEVGDEMGVVARADFLVGRAGVRRDVTVTNVCGQKSDSANLPRSRRTRTYGPRTVEPTVRNIFIIRLYVGIVFAVICDKLVTKP